MTRNLTLRLDEAIIKRARLQAVMEDTSLSHWVAGLILRAVGGQPGYSAVAEEAISAMDEGLHLGGRPFPREELHDR